MIFLARLVHYGFTIYTLGLVLYVICSWLAHPNATSLRLWLARWYEPLLKPIQRVVPPIRLGGSAIDLSPILLLIGLSLLKGLLLSLLMPPI